MRRRWLIGIGAALALFAGGAAAGAAYGYGQDDRLPAGFAVGGLQLGGRPAAQALELLQERLAGLGEVKVQALPPEGDGEAALASRTLGQLGMRASAAEAVKALADYRDAHWWDRLWKRLRGERGGVYPVHVGWEDAVLEREARRTWGDAAGRPAVDAKREITETDEVVYTPEIVGTRVDVEVLAAEVKKLAPSSFADALGRSLRTFRLPMSEVLPQVTVASLKEEGIERKIAEFTTSFVASGEGRTHNVTAAAAALNDTLLQPGEVFEYGQIVEKAEKAYGYREAPVIVQGKLTPGIGGGICQVSSTLYNAILLAGLEVVERRNHSLAVSYLPLGLDATYADGYINFRFRNSTGKHLLIRTVVKDKQVTVKLFGTLDENVTYQTETKQVGTVAPRVKYVGNPSVAPGEQTVLEKGTPGYIVDTYRIKLVNGREVSREKLPRSQYRAQDGLIAVHPEDPRLKPGDRTPPPSENKGPVEPV